jgi:acetyl esterase/lipase
MLLTRVITFLVLASVSLNGGVTVPAANRIQSDFTLRKDVIYTPRKWPTSQLADIYSPDSSAPTPAVLLIHGGGWSDKERRNDMAGIARSLVKRGYFVMNVTYRLTPDWKFPAQREDLRQAMHYLRANSKELNIDTTRFATFGYSAGGHLAALIGLDPSNGVKAIIAGGAPSDLSFWPNGKLTGLLLGGPLKGNREIYREASPVTYVTKDSPPVFIYHGTKDDLVPIEHPKAFIADLEKKGVEHEVYWIEGRSHVMTHLFSAGAIPKAIDFLDKHLAKESTP